MQHEIKTLRYFTCPNGCDHRFNIENLLAVESRDRGPWRWACGECGQYWSFRIEGDHVEVEKAVERFEPVWVILELPPQQEAIRFKMRGRRYVDNNGKSRGDEGLRFFYEEHSRPANWLQETRQVYIGGNQDPHGLWRFVAAFEHDVDGAGVALEPSDAEPSETAPRSFRRDKATEG